MTDESQEVRYAVGNFQVQAQLGNSSGQGISVSGYIYSDDTEIALNDRLDLYKRVMDRQQKISEIPLLEAALRAKQQTLSELEQLNNELIEKQRGGLKLTSQEKLHLRNAAVNIKMHIQHIQEGEKAIAALRRAVV